MSILFMIDKQFPPFHASIQIHPDFFMPHFREIRCRLVKAGEIFNIKGALLRCEKILQSSCLSACSVKSAISQKISGIERSLKRMGPVLAREP